MTSLLRHDLPRKRQAALACSQAIGTWHAALLALVSKEYQRRRDGTHCQQSGAHGGYGSPMVVSVFWRQPSSSGIRLDPVVHVHGPSPRQLPGTVRLSNSVIESPRSPGRGCSSSSHCPRKGRGKIPWVRPIRQRTYPGRAEEAHSWFMVEPETPGETETSPSIVMGSIRPGRVISGPRMGRGSVTRLQQANDASRGGQSLLEIL